MDWIGKLLHATRRAESPRSFILWSGLAAISAIVNNKVWINKRIYNVYPNIYVLIVAKSGMRKAFPVQVAKRLVEDVNVTRSIAGRSSIQAILRDLSKTKTVPERGIIIKDAVAFVNSGEFSTSLVRDPDALTLLTDLFDNHKLWTNNLKGSDKEELKNTCITLLGAMNPTHFNDIITQKEIGGGFIGRSILILEHKRARKDSLLRGNGEDDSINYEDLEEHLIAISNLAGQFELTEKAITLYEKWYGSFEPENIEDITGTANRVHDQILKVSMLIALSKRLELTIDETDIQTSMDLCLQSTTSVNRITAGSGIHVDAPKLKKVISRLLEAPDYTVTRGDLLRKEWGNIDKFDLDRIVETLHEAGGLDYEGTGENTKYTLTKKALEGLEAWKQKIS